MSDSQHNPLFSQRSKPSHERLINPEIVDDELYENLKKIAQIEEIQTILEIGSSSGEGSTQALVAGAKENPSQPQLFCIEFSRARFSELAKRYINEPFVKCYNVSSVSLQDFPKEEEIITFYHQSNSRFKVLPLEEILNWLREGKQALIETQLPHNGIKLIQQENQIKYFDLVLIDGSEFTGFAEFEQVYGAKYLVLDDTKTFKNDRSNRTLFADPNYTLVSSNNWLRNGYSIFKRVTTPLLQQDNKLPIHFFTIVLNGEPFIRYHIEVLKQLPFEWHWHIVEGVADLKHDTAWSLKLGGKVPENLHNNGRSNDGTSEYLDELAKQYPDRVTIYRQPEGKFWEGKREMVNAPLENIQEECLLWQIDVDELWTFEQICNARKLFIKHPEKTAAFYWCWYFMGEELVVSTRNCYTQLPQKQWLRTWRFKPGYVWAAHEPPILVEFLPSGEFRNVAEGAAFSNDKTEAEGLIFQHFAYVMPEQLQFKEQYYGYQNALGQWQNLQAQKQFPVQLRDYLAWVKDDTEVNWASTRGIVPLAQRQSRQGNWQFLTSEELEIEQEKQGWQALKPKIIIDGVFFQRYSTGIARVWISLLQEWAKTGFLEHILFLDRGGTIPDIGGLLSLKIPQHDYNNLESDRALLQEVCDREGADLFISTYYSFPLTTPSVFVAHDMIPEIVGADLAEPMWREKQEAIAYASAYIAVSENTARDLQRFCPEVEAVTVARNGVKYPFEPASPEGIANFKFKYGIAKPYFLLISPGSSYKNGHLFFQAFSQLATKQGFDVVCTRTWDEREFRKYAAGITVHILNLKDEELRLAYAGAVAMVYPSKYEGFGLPVLEAMACGCPVITCPNSSLPEVAGDAPLYVGESDVGAMTEALCEVQKPKVRERAIAAGLQQAGQFSWSQMAETVRSVLLETTLLPLNLRERNTITFPDWTQPEEALAEELQRAIEAIAYHPDRAQMTLLIDSSGISEDDANLFLSAVVMNLLMEKDLEVGEEVAIAVVGELAEMQWEVLLPRLRSRLAFEKENQEAIAQTGCDRLPVISLDTFAANS